jgi:hypothetical protein
MYLCFRFMSHNKFEYFSDYFDIQFLAAEAFEFVPSLPM